MTPVGFVVVGLGNRARTWLRVLDAHPDCRVVGVVDPDPARLAAVEAELSDCVGAQSLDDLPTLDGADVALLCTPPGGRHRQIEAACRASLAILAEKPLADSVSAAEAHVAAAAAAGVPLSVGLNFRYLEVTKALKRLVAGGPLGRPEFARFTYERWRDGHLPDLNKYPLSMPHPMLWEQSVHHFDLMRFVYDAEPVRISARTFNPSWSMYDGDANVSALITFTGGLEVTYQGTWAGNWQSMGFEWRTECERGVALQRDMFGALGYALRDAPELTDVPLPESEPWIDDARGLLDDFLASLRDGAVPPCSGDDHLRSLRMVEACMLASSSDAVVLLNE